MQSHFNYLFFSEVLLCMPALDDIRLMDRENSSLLSLTVADRRLILKKLSWLLHCKDDNNWVVHFILGKTKL